MTLTPAAILAAVGAGAGAATAAVLAASRTLRRPVVEQWRRAARHTRPRSWVVDVVVALGALAGLVALARPGEVGAGHSGVLALVTPGLVVLTAALLGSRLLPRLCRSSFEPTRRRGRVAAFLAVRQLGRRPSTLRLAVVLTVAFGLVTFGIEAWTVARGNQHDRAWTEVGAATVLTVTPPPGEDVGAIVDRLDPSGREAAAVGRTTDYDQVDPVEVLAVQPERFARVAFWRQDFGAAALQTLTDRLSSDIVPQVSLSGDRIEVDVTSSRLTVRHPLVLVADVAQQGAGRAPVDLGVLRPGASGCAPRWRAPRTSVGCRVCTSTDRARPSTPSPRGSSCTPYACTVQGAGTPRATSPADTGGGRPEVAPRRRRADRPV